MATIKELWREAVRLVGEEELARRYRGWITGLIRMARRKAENSDSEGVYGADSRVILADLNARTKSRFTETETAKQLIRKILKKGYLVEDFFKVHEVKCAKWQGDPVAEDWLRPSTLYRECHFDEYLAEWYAMDRQRQELAEKRKESEARVAGERKAGGESKEISTKDANGQESKDKDRGAEERTALLEREGLIRELTSKAWWAHEGWLEFMQWTVRFPDRESQAAYEMPERLRKMREAPGMLIRIAKRERVEWAEAEYAEMKEKRGN